MSDRPLWISVGMVLGAAALGLGLFIGHLLGGLSGG